MNNCHGLIVHNVFQEASIETISSKETNNDMTFFFIYIIDKKSYSGNWKGKKTRLPVVEKLSQNS